MRRLALLLLLLSLGAGATGGGPTAEQLIARVEQARRTSGFRARARLVRTTSDSRKQEVQQLLITGRRRGESTQVLYRVLWPKEAEGRALLVECSADGKTGGFLFEPPQTVTPLTRRVMGQPLFGSDLSVEDVAEEFWRWPSQALAGEAMVAARRCLILESRPGAGSESGYSLVRSWIAPDIALPLLIEKYGRDGRLVKRLVAAKVVKQSGGRWTVAILVIEAAGGPSRTTLEGSRSERDLDLPAEQFTLESIRKSLGQP